MEIELLRLHQRVGLDKPETVNVEGRVTDHIGSLFKTNYEQKTEYVVFHIPCFPIHSIKPHRSTLCTYGAYQL